MTLLRTKQWFCGLAVSICFALIIIQIAIHWFPGFLYITAAGIRAQVRPPPITTVPKIPVTTTSPPLKDIKLLGKRASGWERRWESQYMYLKYFRSMHAPSLLDLSVCRTCTIRQLLFYNYGRLSRKTPLLRKSFPSNIGSCTVWLQYTSTHKGNTHIPRTRTRTCIC